MSEGGSGRGGCAGRLGPPTGHLDVGLTGQSNGRRRHDGTAGPPWWTRGVRRCPPAGGDLILGDAAPGQQVLRIASGQAVSRAVIHGAGEAVRFARLAGPVQPPLGNLCRSAQA
jgi:hypothetical protein